MESAPTHDVLIAVENAQEQVNFQIVMHTVVEKLDHQPEYERTDVITAYLDWLEKQMMEILVKENCCRNV